MDYEPLPGLSEPEAALAPGAPLLFSGIDGNRVLTRTIREGGAARAFSAAAHVVPLRVAQRRISAVAMEPRSVLATFDRFTDELTMWVSCQAPFRIRGEVARLLELPESRVRVIAPDVGGGFGVKTGPYREDVLLAWLARQLGRPVKWVATRARGPGHHQPGARLGLRRRAGAGRGRAHHRRSARRSPRRSDPR